jgi:hypothetical protein
MIHDTRFKESGRLLFTDRNTGRQSSYQRASFHGTPKGANGLDSFAFFAPSRELSQAETHDAESFYLANAISNPHSLSTQPSKST